MLLLSPSDSSFLRGNDLYTMWEGTASRWDSAGGRGDLDTVPLNLWVNANSIFWAGDTVVAHVADTTTGDWWFYPVGPETGALGRAVPATDTWDFVLLPGNRLFQFRGRETESGEETGPFEVLDLDTGEVTEIAGCWMEVEAADDHERCPAGTPNPSGELATLGSKDGSEFMIFDSLEPEDFPRETFVYIWDSETLTEKERFSLGEMDAFGNQLGSSVMTEKYLILHNRRTSQLTIIDRATRERVPFDQGGAAPDRLEHDRARNRIWMIDRGSTAWLLDLDDLSLRHVTEAAPGQTRALASSPTGDRIAVGSDEGNLRIWSDDGELLNVVPLVNPSDAWWLDDEHLVVGTANGPWTVITLNAAELVKTARGRIVRGFTGAECDLYDLDC